MTGRWYRREWNRYLTSRISLFMQSLQTGKILLTDWGRVTHICVGSLTIIGSANGLSPDRRQAITWTNAGILLNGSQFMHFHSRKCIRKRRLRNGAHFVSAPMCCVTIDYDVITRTLTHWGWVMHICVSKLTIIGSDNGLSPGRRQTIIWTNAGILLIRPLGTNFSEILIGVHTFSFRKMELKMSSAKWRPFVSASMS